MQNLPALMLNNNKKKTEKNQDVAINIYFKVSTENITSN